MTRSTRAAATALAAALVVFGGCTHDAFIGAERPSSSTTGVDAAAGRPPVADAHVDVRADARPGPCVQVSCAGVVAACGNCEDDDHDGKVDMDDPECLGPCQNSETTFASVRPGRGACTLDCYFDQDEGFGNDDCVWSHKCDPLAPEGVACAFDPSMKLPHGASCTDSQSPKCQTVCGPLTPNGCDCFGCCDFGGPTSVFLGSADAAGNPSCDLAHVSDPTRCKPCTQVPTCQNLCDPCEVCVGRREPPSSCGNPGSACVVPSCPMGVAACGQDCLPPCASGLSCVTGCCIAPPR